MREHANATGASKMGRWFSSLPPGIAEMARNRKEERDRAANVAQLKARIVDDLREAEEYERHGMLWLADQHRLHVADGVGALIKEGAF